MGDERHHQLGQGAVLGHERVDGRRDPRRVGDRRPAPPAQAGRWSSRSTTCSTRDQVETEYARLYEDIGLGTTIWSPLASGLLTGKYPDGIPDDSRGALAGLRLAAPSGSPTPKSLAKVERLRPIADELGCSLAQLSIAWCAANPNVSTVITGASRPSQVIENFAAIDVLAALTPEVLERIDAAVA